MNCQHRREDRGGMAICPKGPAPHFKGTKQTDTIPIHVYERCKRQDNMWTIDLVQGDQEPVQQSARA